MLNLYITSPNSKDGKTFVATGIAATMQSLGYSTSVYKPIQTNGIEKNGFAQSPDLTFVKTVDAYIDTHFTYIYKTDAEPLIASELENEPIELDLIQREYKRILSSSDCVITDGDRGILSPIGTELQNVNLIKALKQPIVFVITPSISSINDILTSIYVAQDRQLEVRGVIINNIKSECSKVELNSITRIVEEYTNVKIAGLVPNIGEKYTPEDLIACLLNGVDIESLFNVKIEKLDFN